MSGLIGLIVGLAIGAAGGNIAGYLLKNKSLGAVWNSVVGILGGGLGYFTLGLIGIGAGAGAGVIGSLVASLVGGALLLFIISMVRKKT